MSEQPLEPKLVSLSFDEAQEFAALRESLRVVMAQPNGLAQILNAVVAVGDEMVTVNMRLWLNGVEGIDLRDLSALCYGPERIIVDPEYILIGGM